MSVRRAQVEIDAAEFAEWMAYYTMEPWGEDRSDLRAGIIASTIANTQRGKRTKAFKPSDFMPNFDRPRKCKQSPEEMRALFRLITNASGGEVKKAS